MMVVQASSNVRLQTVLIKRSCEHTSFYCQLCKTIVDGDSTQHIKSKAHIQKALSAISTVRLNQKSPVDSALREVVELHGTSFHVGNSTKSGSTLKDNSSPLMPISCRICDVSDFADVNAAHVHASSKKHTDAVVRSLSPASKALVRFVPVQKAEANAVSDDIKQQGQGEKFECAVCECVVRADQRDSHIAGKPHATAVKRRDENKNTAKRRGFHECTVCNVKLFEEQLAVHLVGKRHLQAIKKKQGEKDLPNDQDHTERPRRHQESTRSTSKFECVVCEFVMRIDQRDSHLAGRPHKRREEAQRNNNDISHEEREPPTNVISRSNNQRRSNKLARHRRDDAEPRQTKKEEEKRDPPEMRIDDQWRKNQARSKRPKKGLRRTGGGKGVEPGCAAIKTFLEQVVRKLPPYPLPPHLRSLFSEEFPSIEELYASRRLLSEIGRKMLRSAVVGYDPFIASTPKTALELFARGTGAVRKVLSQCLQLEETSLAIELSAYNKNEDVAITDDTQDNFRFHSVEMPGVSENRPSVLRGDRILVYSDDTRNNTGKSFVGYVHFVNDDKIVMSLPTGFAVSDAEEYSIVFCQNRAQERKLYRAIDKIHFDCILTREEVLREIDHTRASPITDRLLTDFGAELNEEQRSFVEGVRGPKRLCALWGPPGTGKTTAMVAAIYDTYTRHVRNGTRVSILVSAPSNEAADLLAERLLLELKTDPQEQILLRIPALTRDPKLIKGDLKDYCPEIIYGSFSFPPKEEIEQFPIIVTTLMTADRLYAVDCQKFTHFFVDEAGHASEQLLLVGLNAACNKHTKIVLAGDPMQLGPRFNTPLLLETGLATSPLSRFVEDDSLWEAIGHQLISSYRCHIDIIRLINVSYEEKIVSARSSQDHEDTRRKIAPLWRTDLLRGFWGSHCRLHPEADPHLLNGAHQREKKDQAEFVPRTVLAINHTYPESREKDSPSWMNTFEIQTVVELCKTLFFEKIITSFHEVAIITPYRKQRTAIEARLYSTMLNDVELKGRMESFETKKDIRLRVPMKVATVDSFQGREARVVIVSCVRSNMKVACNDSKFGLGFLGQPTRANVALSRAKDLLIIVGNRTVLTNDATWSRYFERIDELGEGAYMDLGGPQIVSGELSDESTDENNGNMLGLETVAERTVE